MKFGSIFNVFFKSLIILLPTQSSIFLFSFFRYLAQQKHKNSKLRGGEFASVSQRLRLKLEPMGRAGSREPRRFWKPIRYNIKMTGR